MIFKAQMQTVGDKTVISGLRWYTSDRYGLLITVGTCESFFFVRIESRIESAVRFVFESNVRIESAVYHASRNTA